MATTIKKKAYAGKNQPEQQIVSLANSVSAFVAANRKAFTVGFSVLAAIVVIGAGFLLKRSLDERSAGPLFAAAYDVYSRNDSGGADYGKALELFRAIAQKYPSSVSGAMARYYAANCLMGLGRNEEALKEYQTVIKDYPNNHLLSGLAYGRMGYLYRETAKPDDAVKAFEHQESLMGPGAATIELARLYEAEGKEQESQKEYKTIAEKLAGTTWAVEAMGKIQKTAPVPASAKQGK